VWDNKGKNINYYYYYYYIICGLQFRAWELLSRQMDIFHDNSIGKIVNGFTTVFNGFGSVK
jgi:hypothetical protein